MAEEWIEFLCREDWNCVEVQLERQGKTSLARDSEQDE